MASYNKVILIGNLTRDPELRYTPSQTAVVDFGMAVNRRWKTPDGADRSEACFVDCTMFGKRAEVINKFFRKGSAIFVEGRLTYDAWTSQDGSKRSKLKVTVENFEFVGSAGNSQGQRAAGPGRREAAPSEEQPMDDFDQAPPDAPHDEIPF